MLQKCPSCNGMGHFDTWGKPCMQNSMHRKLPCGVCHGACTVTGNYVKCNDCSGLGGRNTWGKPCRQTDMHFVSPCPMCQGGYKNAGGGHHHHHHHHQHHHHQHHHGPPAEISGVWSEFPPSANTMTIAQMGDKATVTCPTQPWSPAHANISGTTVTFVSGMPAGLAATYDPMSQRMSFTNGVVWTKGGVPAPAPAPAPIPAPVAAVQVAGQWNEVPATQNVMAITQLGDKITVACPTQPWSPAHADVNGNVLTFRSGMPAGMTATFDPMQKMLSFSNGCRWVMGSPLDGTWVEHPRTAHTMSAIVAGNQITVQCPTQPWSPATGTVTGNSITFTTGMPGLTAAFEPGVNQLAFSNGCRWQKL
eukprot:TRINITY_DN152_c1_g1_i1.p1 TRINITY_DN152_c1_g1~~TRINITY_DN152_c1_g1_i1.p1  ORF type:complete len:363 (+),score=62.57 TRINITY_DN152_c1_g1_i1:73-1161(+)